MYNLFRLRVLHLRLAICTKYIDKHLLFKEMLLEITSS